MPILVRAFDSGTLWLGISLLMLFFVSYMLVLSWADFSYVSPASAVGYVLVALMGYFFLGEHVPTSAGWESPDLRGSFPGGRDASQYEAEPMSLRTALFIGIIVLCGEGGDISLSCAMKKIGEVKSFTPRNLLRTLGRAFKLVGCGWGSV